MIKKANGLKKQIAKKELETFYGHFGDSPFSKSPQKKSIIKNPGKMKIYTS